jgi:lipoate-protein ligase A
MNVNPRSQLWDSARVLLSFGGEGSLQMAFDEALLESAEARPLPAVLRFYTWDPPAISLGRFQDPEAAVDVASAARAGVSVVRRPTGGRAVLHDGDLTYALVARRDDPVFGGPRNESLRAVAQALAAGLARVGISTTGAAARAQSEARAPADSMRIESRARADEASRDRASRSVIPPCFVSPVREELCVGGRKLLGSARVEGRFAFLQHGSLPLARGPAEIARFRPGDAASREGARARLAAHATSLAEAAPALFAQLDVARLCDALRLGFASRAARPFLPGEATAAERARAADLAPRFSVHPVEAPAT